MHRRLLLSLFALFSTLLLVGGAAAQDADACRDVLIFAGNRYLSTLTATELSDLDYYFNCTETGRASQGSFNVVYAGIGFGAGGSSYKTTQDCTEKQRAIETSTIESELRTEPVREAIDMWGACMQARERSLTVKPFDDGAGYGVQLTNTKSGEGSMTFFVEVSVEGLPTPGSCNILPPTAADETTPASSTFRTMHVKNGASVNISCARPRLNEARVGLSTDYYPRSTIRLTSDSSPTLGFPYPESLIKADTRVADLTARVNQLQTSLSGLQSQMSTGASFIGMGTYGWDHRFFKQSDYDGGNPNSPFVPQEAASCPAGQVVVGLKMWGASHDACLGCMIGIQPICGKIGN